MPMATAAAMTGSMTTQVQETEVRTGKEARNFQGKLLQREWDKKCKYKPHPNPWLTANYLQMGHHSRRSGKTTETREWEGWLLENESRTGEVCVCCFTNWAHSPNTQLRRQGSNTSWVWHVGGQSRRWAELLESRGTPTSKETSGELPNLSLISAFFFFPSEVL